ncbi:MAG: flagellar biosynthetic protein FliO [Pseudomonadota bacterium]|jgi:flagellar protein FliO/FliZ
MLQVTFGLLLVLGMIAGLAWAIARLGRMRPASNATVRVVAAASVGPRERVAVVEVGGQWLVLGVAPGSVNLLDKTAPQAAGTTRFASMTGDAASGAVSLPPLPPFAAWLQRALKRKQD